MAQRMDVDGDSMDEEGEWTPGTLGAVSASGRRKVTRKRATRVPITGDGGIPRPRKRKRPDNQATNVIEQMKKGRDYEKRSSTKILPSNASDTLQPIIRKKKNAPKRSRKKKQMNSSATIQLIHQKTTQNVLHSNIPLTTQEKFLQRQYGLIEALVAKKKQSARKKQVVSDSSVLQQAMGLDDTASSNIILEPGQQAPTTSHSHHTASTKTKTELEFEGVSEAFIKPSTQFATQQRSWTTSRGAIDADNYFDSKKGATGPSTVDEAQQRALQKLKQSGDTSIGKAIAVKKQTKFSIKRAKSAKRTSASLHHVPSISTPSHNAAVTANTPHAVGGGGGDDLNDLGGDLNGMMDVGQGGEGGDNGNITTNNGNNTSGLNSTFDSLPTFGDRQETDKTTLNLQKFELARKAAEDESNAIDAEEHMENCNVYVGGLHPEVDQSMLRKFFQHCGEIRQIRLDWRKKGFGFIHYSTHEQAREAIEDMDGRLILGQPIKCRWAKNKTKEQERLMRLEKEKQALLEEQKNPNDPNDPNNLNQNVIVPEEMSNADGQMYHRNSNNAGNEKKKASESAIGFLGRRKTKKHSPPALEAKVQLETSVVDNDTDKSDVDTEYW